MKLDQIQSINITKGVLRGLGEGDKININYSPVMVVNNGETTKQKEIKKMLWTVVDALPDPKLDNLFYLAAEVCIDAHKTQVLAAKYLGVAQQTISRYKGEANRRQLLSGGGHEDTNNKA